MSGFTLEKRPKRHDWKACENACRKANGNLKGATYIAWLLDTPIYLCERCSKDWAECWDRAGSVEQEAAASA